jgi:broad specificity phosphatase PhoE
MMVPSQTALNVKTLSRMEYPANGNKYMKNSFIADHRNRSLEYVAHTDLPSVRVLPNVAGDGSAAENGPSVWRRATDGLTAFATGGDRLRLISSSTSLIRTSSRSWIGMPKTERWHRRCSTLSVAFGRFTRWPAGTVTTLSQPHQTRLAPGRLDGAHPRT